MFMYKCECGREFEKKSSLNSHYRFCKIHKPKSKCSSYKTDYNTYKCECGKEFNNYQSLNVHFSHCNYHHKQVGTIRKLRPNEINHSMNWENKSAEEIYDIRQRSSKTYSKNIKSGKTNPSFLNKSHTENTKEKIRKSTIDYISNLNDKCIARYSKTACEYIDKLNIQNNWNLQHAENGGEVQIFGYFLDGYDKELNIVFEYDEPYHYIDKYNNILCEKDITRQNYIIKKLNCKFYRYNEALDLFYQVN